MLPRQFRLLAATVFALCVVSPALADVFRMPPGLTSLEFVGADNAGNTADARTMNDGTSGYGSVNYTYKIAKFEITAAQYAEFLNAVARTDAYGLYNESMANVVGASGCNIQRSGAEGSYTYSVAADFANVPVNYVSYGDGLRFANWLTNGQPATGLQDMSTTETGSYCLNGAIENEDLLAVVRKSTARYVLPTEDEWYKAAYHQNNGATGDYWSFPTRGDTAPSYAAPPGASEPPGSANYKQAANAYLTEVGAYVNSASAYGTYDQGGNVWEWNEGTLTGTTYRGTRGGSFLSGEANLLGADRRYGFSPIREYNFIGFRVAEVPEPSVVCLLASCLAAFGSALLVCGKKVPR